MTERLDYLFEESDILESVKSEINLGSYFHKRTDLHILRKLWHMGTGTFGLFCFFFFEVEKENMTFFLLKLTVFAFIFDLVRIKFSRVNSTVMFFMKPFMRGSEKKSLTGLPFYALGVTVSLILYQEKLAILSIMFLVFSDPVSSFFGVLFGKQKILPNKTFEGCVAGYLTCYFLTLIYGFSLGVSGYNLFIFSILAGLIGMLAEAVSMGLDDNLTIPIIAGSGLTLLNLFIPVF